MKATFENFVKYVKAQEPERKINHRDGWECCSIGDFVSENFGAPRFTQNFYGIIETLLLEFPNQLRLTLAFPPAISKKIGPNHTYGELASWLTKQGY